MKKLLLTLSLFAFAAQSFAALSPYYRSKKEIRALLDSEKVDKKLGGGAIQSIEAYGDKYYITAGSCELKVDVNYVNQHNGPVGPGRMELQVGECESTGR